MQLLKTSLMALCLTAATITSFAADIIPAPQKYVKKNGSFALKSTTTISYTSELKKEAELLFGALSPATGWDLELKKGAVKSNTIALIIDKDSGIEAEGYKLNSSSNMVTIKASDKAGIFYGIQTLLQMLPPETFSKQRQRTVKWSIEAATIEDNPVYPWRGMMLDVSRYFMDLDYVKKYIDMMAMHKMNILHLHLVDDPGWRVEIKKYPKLTQIGAYRDKGAKRHGGYYTQDEIREMVKYATERHIEIIPEIEVPAHVQSALVAYPHLSCTGKQLEMPTRCYISREIYCAGKETTFKFLEDVLTEVMDLFPAKFIHIGGDEAKYDRWKKCPHCKKRMKDEGLKNCHELQSYVTRRMEKFLMQHGRRLIGWDEILDGGLAPNATVMTWHRYQTAIQAAKSGNNVVMALTGHAYFDAPESKLPGEPPAATWIAPISLQKAYEWEPAPKVLNNEEKKFVLGAHGCLWTDRFMHNPILQDWPALDEVRSMNYVDYLSLPRMGALSEVVWTAQKKRNYSDFLKRMQIHYNRYGNAGYHYRVPLPLVNKPVKVADGYKITLTCPVDGAMVRYTTDGKTPMAESPIFTDFVIVKDPQMFRAATYVNRRKFSLTFAFPEDQMKKYEKKYGDKVGEWKAGKVPGKTFKAVDFDATGKINANGKYQISFLYTEGECRLEITKVEIVVNNKVVATDRHFGFTGGSSKNNSYTVDVKEYETGANFYIRATIRGDLNNNSNGIVFIKKK